MVASVAELLEFAEMVPGLEPRKNASLLMTRTKTNEPFFNLSARTG